jgi:simple sugar transport system permease protein
MLQDTLKLATPLALGAMAGIFCERSGVFNIAIEGMMLSAAFTAACFASLFDSLWMGVLIGIITGGLAAALHAWLSIKYKVDQIISGTVINILAAGATRFLNVRLADPAGLSTPGKFDPVAIPVLSEIPVIGPIFFNQEPIVYIMLILLPMVQFVLFSTPWGLRLRACGEHPRAADTVGVNVNRMRYIAVILGGMIAGIGGAFFSVGEVGSFEDSMTRGAGFVALAAMIFGKWNPFGAFGAALLFGFAGALQVKMQSIAPVLPFVNVPIPPEFLQMTPYILTIIVLAGAVGKAVGPAAGGKPYEKQ